MQNAELVTLTYGSIVAQLCKDMEGDYLEVNKQLEKMGYNIGLRLIEDFLAKTNMGKCANFRETAETISKVCFNTLRRFPFFLKYLEAGIKRTCYVALSIFTYSWLRGGKQIGFKVFLNITPAVTNWTTDGKQFSLIFEENPLADFVELPDDGRAQNELWYSNLLCGVLRGSLEMVSSP